MARITRIEISHHRLDLDPPFFPSWDSQARRVFDATIVRVHSDAGLVGVASGDVMAGFEGHEHLFVGQDVLALERHYRILSNLDFFYGRCWPLDVALWDLAGKTLGQPVWKLLGGLSSRLRAYASSGTLRDPGAMAETAESFLERGFPAMKLRFRRGDWRDDVRALEAVRARIGDRLLLMVDCNQGWRMPWDAEDPWLLKDALRVARELERLDVYWMEEPLHRANRDDMRRLREATDLRIAGAEMTRGLHELETLVTEGCLDVIQPDAVLTCGITGLRRLAMLAVDRGVEFTPHTWGNGMGLLANCQLAAGLSAPNYIEFPFDPPEWSTERRDYMIRGTTEVDAEGWIALGDEPGIGYEPDDEVLAKTRT